jgi:hypothetical protein
MSFRLREIINAILSWFGGGASVGVAPWIEKSHATLCAATRPSTMIGGAPSSIGGAPARHHPAEGRSRARQISGDLDISKWSLQMASIRRTLLLRS